jgi:hypothetical protein
MPPGIEMIIIQASIAIAEHSERIALKLISREHPEGKNLCTSILRLHLALLRMLERLK